MTSGSNAWASLPRPRCRLPTAVSPPPHGDVDLPERVGGYRQEPDIWLPPDRTRRRCPPGSGGAAVGRSRRAGEPGRSGARTGGLGLWLLTESNPVPEADDLFADRPGRRGPSPRASLNASVSPARPAFSASAIPARPTLSACREPGPRRGPRRGGVRVRRRTRGPG